MKFITELTTSIRSFWKAFLLIQEFKLLRYVVVLMFLVLLFVLPVLIIGSTSIFFSSFIPYFDGEKYSEIGVGILASMSGFFLLLLLIPVFSLVSEEVNNKLSGIETKFSLKQFIKDILRGLRITLRNLFYEYLFVVVIIILLSFLPEISFIALISKSAVFLITSYFYGFSILDYAMENQQMNYKKSIRFARSHLGLVIGLGMVYYFVIIINNFPFFISLFGKMSIYWTTFAEAIIAFIGVIAANIVLNKALLKEYNLQ